MVFPQENDRVKQPRDENVCDVGDDFTRAELEAADLFGTISKGFEEDEDL